MIRAEAARTVARRIAEVLDPNASEIAISLVATIIMNAVDKDELRQSLITERYQGADVLAKHRGTK